MDFVFLSYHSPNEIRKWLCLACAKCYEDGCPVRTWRDWENKLIGEAGIRRRM